MSAIAVQLLVTEECIVGGTPVRAGLYGGSLLEGADSTVTTGRSTTYFMFVSTKVSANSAVKAIITKLDVTDLVSSSKILELWD